MGLDARVYCDCFERGRIKVPPRPEWKVYVDGNGDRCMDLHEFDAFLAWNATACEHPFAELLHYRIGNVALIGFFRSVLREQSERFPRILSKVIYSGSHAGDFLTIDEVKALGPELASLHDVHGGTRREEEFLRGFEQQLKDLVNVALSVGKPIAF